MNLRACRHVLRRDILRRLGLATPETVDGSNRSYPKSLKPGRQAGSQARFFSGGCRRPGERQYQTETGIRVQGPATNYLKTHFS
jgi:hypothetical protein